MKVTWLKCLLGEVFHKNRSTKEECVCFLTLGLVPGWGHDLAIMMRVCMSEKASKIWVMCLNLLTTTPEKQTNKQINNKNKNKKQEITLEHSILKLHVMTMKVLITQSRPTLCDPMDCSLPASSVRRIS